KSSGIQRPNSAHSPTLRLSTDGGTPPGPYVLTAHCIVYANAALPAPFPNFPPVITDTVPPTTALVIKPLILGSPPPAIPARLPKPALINPWPYSPPIITLEVPPNMPLARKSSSGSIPDKAPADTPAIRATPRFRVAP